MVNIIKSSVLFIVFITTIVLGALMPAYIKCSLSRASKMIGNIPESRVSLIQAEKKNKKPGFFKTMDEGYFKPWFIRDYEEKKSVMAEEKRLMKLSSSQYAGVKPRTFT